ncbi:hypothetical protein JF535_14355 [Microbulbifer salipaludis]|uniref:Uncharacterized protein n=1 Tax=Microbulbifer salipaludis TaxID=187980 RepID=A0ABS3E9Q3_9GAMM|nr:hypothetical protein [Microbulbifer salipaludis]MBN8432031.1 hypothetical protein [Microbulbifer salipaludis]
MSQIVIQLCLPGRRGMYSAAALGLRAMVPSSWLRSFCICLSITLCKHLCAKRICAVVSTGVRRMIT